MFKLVSLEDQIGQGCLDVSVGPDPFALRSLKGALGISKTEISASLRRSIAATLAIKSKDRPKVNRRNLTKSVPEAGLKDERLYEFLALVDAIRLATKLEACAGRGGNDPIGSHDLEDIIQVVDGRPSLLSEVQAVQDDVREQALAGLG